MSKTYEIGHMLAVQHMQTRKKFAGEIIAVHKNRLRLEVVNLYGDCETHDVSIGEDYKLLAQLGETPVAGSVYGCQVRKLYGQSEVPFYGVVSFFRNITDEEKDTLKAALKGALSHIKHLGLDKIIQLDNLIVLEPKGKYAGYYRQDRHGNHICYHPKEISPRSSMFLMDHEMAHAIWFQCLKDEARADWIRLYTEYVESHKIPDDCLEDVVNTIIAEGRPIEEYEDLLADYEHGSTWLYRIMHSVADMLFLNIEEVGLHLISMGRKERKRLINRALTSVSPIESDHVESFPISEYAKKSVAEFFAEAYCWYINHSRTVPEEVETLLKSTLPGIGKLKDVGIYEDAPAVEDDEDEDED